MNDHLPLMSVRELRIGFASEQKTLTAVDGVSFDLLPGQTFALLGESGCGKSATAQALMHLLPTAGRYLGGQILLADGQDVLTLDNAELRKIRGKKIAMIFQEPATSLNPVLTVGEQINEVLAIHRDLQGAEAQNEALALLQLVGIADPERRLAEYPFQFSGGMKQRVMIAIALAGEPDILIADEPTTALDVTVQAQILDLLKQLQHQRKMAILLITHDLGVLAQMADRIGVMYAGQLVEVASRTSFFSSPQHPYSKALFAALPEAVQRGERLVALPGQVPSLSAMPRGCRFAERCPLVMSQCKTNEPIWEPIATATDHHIVRCWAAQADKTTNPPLGALNPINQIAKNGDELVAQNTQQQAVLTVKDLRVHFPIRRGILQRTVGHVKAVDGLEFLLQPGKTLALVGESGCGKTSVGKALLQLTKPTTGSICVAGQEWNGLSSAALRPLRQHMQMVFQDPFASLNPRMRVAEILAEGWGTRPFKLGKTRNNKEHEHQALSSLLKQVGLGEDSLDRFPHEFSGGQRQRIAIARALAMQPKVIICDEPTSALDVSVQAQILNLLRELQQSLGIAYLFITHNFGVVNYLADQVAVMYLGRIVETGAASNILHKPQHPYTQALLSAVPTIKTTNQNTAEHKAAVSLKGELPSPANPPTGCHFHPRCPKAQGICRETYPDFREAGEHRVACHLVDFF